MEAKLIKDKHIDNFYYLMVGINTYATTHKESFRVLSLKNCQAIELGYDLDELEQLAQKDIHNLKPINPHPTSFFAGYRRGFQKALEILGDKKFSEEDVRDAYFHGEKDSYTKGGQTKEMENQFIQSLQQTEWDCIIFVDEKTKEPLLDNEGNLILKRR
jgi:hypothetical protein